MDRQTCNTSVVVTDGGLLSMPCDEGVGVMVLVMMVMVMMVIVMMLKLLCSSSSIHC